MSKPFVPHGYQDRGIRLLLSSAGAGLWLDPGMGKTSTALAAFDILQEQDLAQKMLVVAPINPMYDTWPKEPQKWEEFKHLKVCIVHGKNKKKALEEEADIYIVNPEGLVWYLDQPNRPKCEILCVDESTKFKNPQSKRFKKLRKHLHEFERRWTLTGTPAPNGLLDLFSQVFIMDRGEALGQYITHFKNKYFYQTGFGGYTWSPFPDSLDAISTAIAPMILKLDAEDYLDMPEFNKVKIPIELDSKSMMMYKEIQDEFLLTLGENTVVAANAAAAGTKCRQIANGALYIENKEWTEVHDKKIKALENIVEETNGHPLFILYEFEHDRHRIQEFLGKDCVCITGVSGPKLNKISEDFNSGKIKYLLAHPGSSHGLNIQGHCFHMVWFGITWNLEHFIQAVWRLYRQGQSSSMVMCYLLVAQGTLDERVVEVLNHKEAEQEELENLLIQFRQEIDAYES